MRYCSLGSGSRGNATVVAQGNTSLLVDCGFSRKNLVTRLQQAQVDVRGLQGVLVTHEHGDHAKGVLTVCESFDVPFYTSFGTARKMGWLSHPLWQCIRGDEPIRIGFWDVMPVVVPHDAQEPLQFVIRDERGLVLGLLSDLGSLTTHLLHHYRACHGLQVEANHDLPLLRAGPYPPSLQARVAGRFGHLSNEQCADFLHRVRWSGLQKISAGHISEKNNDRTIVRSCLAPVLQCRPEEVNLLEQDAVSDWYCLA